MGLPRFCQRASGVPRVSCARGQSQFGRLPPGPFVAEYMQRMSWEQERNEGGKGGTFTRATNHCGGAGKSQQCHKHFIQYSKFASIRLQVRTWVAKLLLAPGTISARYAPGWERKDVES